MAETFNIGHETDLSEYTATVTGGGDLSQSGAAALGGTSGGMSVLIDDTGAIYGQKDFTELSNGVYRCRFYVDPNSLTMASGNAFVVAGLYNNGNGRTLVFLRYDGSNYEIRARQFDDASSTHDTSPYDITDAEHYVEILVTYAASDVSNDATLDLWIDGALQEQLSGLDVYDLTEPDEARLGAVDSIDSGTSGTCYLDEFVLRDDATEIGPTGTIVAPTAISAVAATIAPTVVAGPIAPTAVSAVGATVAPTVVLGSLTVEPSAVSAVGRTTGPQILVPLVISLLDPGGVHTQIAGAGDVLHLKAGVAGSTKEIWAEVDSVVDQTTYYDYNVSIVSGAAFAFPAGTTVINYGVSGEGILLFDTETKNPPHLTALTHLGAPYDTVIPHAVLGNLEGYTAEGEWGLIIGDNLNTLTGDYFVLSSERFHLDADLEVATGRGFQFEDGGHEGWVLADDGTGLFIPTESGGGGGIDLDASEGALIYGNSVPEWAVLTHPGSAYQHLETSASGIAWQTRLTLSTDVATETPIHMTAAGGISTIGNFHILIDSDDTTGNARFEIAKDAQRRVEDTYGVSLWYVAENSVVGMRHGGVDHGATALVDHTDVFGDIRLYDSNAGGFQITGLRDGGGEDHSALVLRGAMAQNVDTTTNSQCRALVEVYGGLTSGTDWANVNANGNIFCVRAYKSGSFSTVLKVDEDGDLWIPGTLNASGLSVQIQMDTSSVTDLAPTDAELDAIFGTPATVGAGFTAWINDSGAGVNVFGVVSTGSAWRYWRTHLAPSP